MPIDITCPSCEIDLRVDDQVTGQNVQCPKCRATFSATPLALPQADNDAGLNIFVNGINTPSRQNSPTGAGSGNTMSRRAFESKVKSAQSKIKLHMFIAMNLIGFIALPIGWLVFAIDTDNLLFLPLTIMFGVLVLGGIATLIATPIATARRHCPKCPKCYKTIMGLHQAKVLKTSACPHCKSRIIHG